jgi:hypothetical protein
MSPVFTGCVRSATATQTQRGKEDIAEALGVAIGVNAVKSRGMTVFAHIDHAATASEVGMTLRPTDLLIFGGPKGGTPLMQSAQTIGIDLRLKALVWEDAEGRAW